MQSMEKKPTLLHCPPDALFDFADQALKKFSPKETQYISYRELLEFIENWIDQNFEEP